MLTRPSDTSRAKIETMTPDQIDGSFVPVVVGELTPVDIGDERVLLDGWTAALVLNPSGTVIWDSLDGASSLDDVADDLAAATDADREQVFDIVLAFTKELGHLGRLDGVIPEAGPHIELIGDKPLGPGDSFAGVKGADLDGVTRTLDEIADGDVLAINWNPHCGYCVSIAPRLAELDGPLRAAGVTMVLIAFGDEQTNRRLVEEAGLTSPLLLLGDADSPFGVVGTPSAARLGSDQVIDSLAYGNVEVPRLAATLAGIEIDESADRTRDMAGEPRYLLEQDGFCAPGTGVTTAWADTRVYRVGDHHVGIRVDAHETAETLDDLFEHRVVEDPRAGHSYTVALPSLAKPAATKTAGAGMNLLVQPTRAPVRSRDPGRILQALLADLHDRIDEEGVADGHLRVNAIAVRSDSGAGLIPKEFVSFQPRLQSLLAKRGVAIADLPRPVVDLTTAELVIPAPAIDHDPAVLRRVSQPPSKGGERPAPGPGRYPLVGWCVIHPGNETFVALSPAQAAAATVSSLVEADDPAARLSQLGNLFVRVPAYGLWYYSDIQVADLVARALKA